MAENEREWLRMAENEREWLRMAGNGFGMAKNGREYLSSRAPNGLHFCRSGPPGQNLELQILGPAHPPFRLGRSTRSGANFFPDLRSSLTFQSFS